MRNRLMVLALIIAALSFGVTVFSQEQGQSQSQPPATSSTSPSVDNQGIGTYLLGPGDTLDVRVFGQPDLNSVVEIDGDGNISSLPFLESPIKAMCRTDKQVQRDISTAYAKYIKNPQVSVRIMERKSRLPATISGAVRTPLQVTMMRKVRLHELITRAGGTTDRASGTVQILHQGPPMCAEPGEEQKPATNENPYGFAVYKLADLRSGKEEADPYVWPGDLVQVNEGEPVYIIGQVMAPRELVLRDQLTLQRAILMAGGVQSIAKTNEIHVWRLKEGQAAPEHLTYNLDEIKKGRAPDVLLKANDVIEVGKSGLMSAKGMGGFVKDIFRSTVGGVATRAVIF